MFDNVQDFVFLYKQAPKLQQYSTTHFSMMVTVAAMKGKETWKIRNPKIREVRG
jgi:hypothetical protein